MITRKTILTFCLLLTGAGAIVFAISHRALQAKVIVNAPVIEKPPVYDTLLVKKFSALLQSMDFNKSSFRYEGKFNIRDGKDTSGKITALNFLYEKRGKIFYSKIGDNEVINDDGTNIYIEQATKRVVFSHQKFIINPALSGLGPLIEKMRSEDYTLTESLSAGQEKISMLNEHHITCKELSVTADTSGKLQKVLLRYSDVTDPLNKAKDRTVEVVVNHIGTDRHNIRFPGIKDILKETNGKMELREQYAAYELITL